MVLADLRQHSIESEITLIEEVHPPPPSSDTMSIYMIVDVYITSECIHLCILCIVTRYLFRDVSIMYLSHVVMP